MYIFYYNTGAIRWADELNLKNTVHLLATGSLLAIVNVEKKKALLKTPDNKIGWAEIPEIEIPTDEEMELIKKGVE